MLLVERERGWVCLLATLPAVAHLVRVSAEEGSQLSRQREKNIAGASRYFTR